MRLRKIKVLSESFFTSEHIVDLHTQIFAFAGFMAFVCTLKILSGFIGVTLMEILDLAELFVKLFKLIAGRDGLHFLLP
jgi:hypothetical protein